MNNRHGDRILAAGRQTTALMHEDCKLGDALALADAPPVDLPALALVTGVTGFLGPHAVQQLLLETGMRLVCLVRADTEELATARMQESLEALGIDSAVIASRVTALAGDLSRPSLGLSPDSFARLCDTVDRVYHLGATVNWTQSYEQLRQTNVLGCLELVRLAVTGRRKPMLFVSTIAVCFAREMEGPVDETTDMSEHAGEMPLAYAQSKWVAESILRRMALRGLPVTVLRPALISGDSRSGIGNRGDLIAAVIEATVATQAAMDCDWLIDFVPVDHVASMICRALDASQRWRVIHLVHDQPRPWRELVLWFNLNGYPVRLIDERNWQDLMFDAKVARQRLLYGYRGFFNGSPRAGVPAKFQSYVGDAQRRVSHEASFAEARRLGLAPVPIDAGLLHRYVRQYQASGVIQPPAIASRETCQPEHRHQAAALAALERIRPQGGGEWIQMPLGAANNGVLSGIAAARLGSQVGVRHFRWSGAPDGQPRDIIVKTKPSDHVLMELTCELASICSPALGTAFRQHGRDLGLAGSHERELAFYERQEPRLSRFLPRTYGILRDGESGLWTIAMQHVGASCASAVPDQLGIWTPRSIAAAIAGIAQVHSIWYRRTADLAGSGYRIEGEAPDRMRARRDLWLALQQYAQPLFEAWGGPSLLRRHESVVNPQLSWLDALFEGHRTLIHNDFNPRNVFLDADSDEELCIIDWELARVGLPQHDLAEFLCFAMDPRCDASQLRRWIEAHRALLGAATGFAIDQAQWYQGLAASLDFLLAERLPMYTLIHKFQPQRFLPRLVRSWLRLRDVVQAGCEGHASEPAAAFGQP